MYIWLPNKNTVLKLALYAKLNDKSFNLRNVYDVVFSRGPFFPDQTVISLSMYIQKRNRKRDLNLTGR